MPTSSVSFSVHVRPLSFAFSDYLSLTLRILATVVLGAFFGCLAASAIGNKYGRRPILSLASIGTLFGAALQAGSTNLGMFIASRLINGARSFLVLFYYRLGGWVKLTRSIFAFPRFRSRYPNVCRSLLHGRAFQAQDSRTHDE
jgi:MFS family permease